MEFLEDVTLKHRIGDAMELNLLDIGIKSPTPSMPPAKERSSRHQAREPLRHRTRPRQDPRFGLAKKPIRVTRRLTS